MIDLLETQKLIGRWLIRRVWLTRFQARIISFSKMPDYTLVFAFVNRWHVQCHSYKQRNLLVLYIWGHSWLKIGNLNLKVITFQKRSILKQLLVAVALNIIRSSFKIGGRVQSTSILSVNLPVYVWYLKKAKTALSWNWNSRKN